MRIRAAVVHAHRVEQLLYMRIFRHHLPVPLAVHGVRFIPECQRGACLVAHSPAYEHPLIKEIRTSGRQDVASMLTGRASKLYLQQHSTVGLNWGSIVTCETRFAM